MRKHGEVEAKAVVPVTMHLSAFASGAGEASCSAESAEGAVAIAAQELGFVVHCCQDG